MIKYTACEQVRLEVMASLFAFCFPTWLETSSSPGSTGMGCIITLLKCLFLISVISVMGTKISTDVSHNVLM